MKLHKDFALREAEEEGNALQCFTQANAFKLD